MLIDVFSSPLIQNPTLSDYLVKYYLSSDLRQKNAALVLLNKLLTFHVRGDAYCSSIHDFFLFKQHADNPNYGLEVNITDKCLEVCKEWLLTVKRKTDIKNGNIKLACKPTLKNSLYGDQEVILRYLLENNRGANCSSVGLGKTITSLAHFNVLKNQGKVEKGLITCLNENKGTWKNEIIKHSDYKYLIVGNGTKNVLKDLENQDYDLLVVHYDCLRKVEIRNKICECKFNHIICDEAHTFRNENKLTSAIFDLFYTLNPTYALFLTATPLPESPIHAYSILHLINPTLVPKREKFKQHFCNFFKMPVKKWVMRRGKKVQIEVKVDILRKDKPYKNLDQLKELVDNYIIRYTHDSVKDFPPTMEKVIELDLSPKQRRLYNVIKEETYKQIAAEPDKAMNLHHILTKTLRLRQATSYPGILGEDTPSIKLDYLDKLLQEILEESNEKIVLWSTFRPTLEFLQKKYEDTWGAGLFCGIKSEKDRVLREETITKFCSDSKDCRLLSAITSLGTGGNWGRARTAIYIDRPLKLLEWNQSRGRITRRDAIGTSTIISLRCRDTIDEWVDALLARKELSIGSIVDPDQMNISKEEILEVLK